VGGVLVGDGQISLTVMMDDSVTNLAAGGLSSDAFVHQFGFGGCSKPPILLRVGQPDKFTEIFDSATNDLAFRTFTFTPDGITSFYSVCQEPANISSRIRRAEYSWLSLMMDLQRSI